MVEIKNKIVDASKMSFSSLNQKPLAFMVIFLFIFFFGMAAITISADVATQIDIISLDANQSILVTVNDSATLLGSTRVFSAVSNNETWLDFDGVNDFVDDNDFINFPNGTSLAISAWINTDVNRSDAVWNSILNTSTIMWFLDDAPKIVIKRNDTKDINIQFQIRNETSGVNNFLEFEIDDTFTGWHHILGNFNLTDGNQSLWVDGVRVQTSIATTGNVAKGDDLRVGRDDNNRFFIGGIDEVRAYNTSLTDSQIIEIFDSGRVQNASLPSDGLIVWYGFDEGTGQIAHDLSGNNNDGT